MKKTRTSAIHRPLWLYHLPEDDKLSSFMKVLVLIKKYKNLQKEEWKYQKSLRLLSGINTTARKVEPIETGVTKNQAIFGGRSNRTVEFFAWETGLVRWRRRKRHTGFDPLRPPLRHLVSEWNWTEKFANWNNIN